ncbi:MAG TPA: BT4734/BF3469 family protein [Verrucomicrobiae bacterium]|nr:BT4734/BF3469 family protein [Verrucomicrobiae bacterium]
MDSLKKKLGAVTLAGIQAMRGNKFVPQFTGLIQADFDLLGDKLKYIRELLADDPHVFCVFISATGEGLKAWYRIPICKNADEYKFAFDTLAAHVLKFTGCKIDELPETARLCFASHDKDCYHNPNATELPVDFAQMPPPADEIKKAAKSIPSKSPALNGESRRVIAEKIVGLIESTEAGDFCKCLGEHLHTNGNAPKDCRVTLDGVPTIFCLHKSCSQVIETANHELRSQIGKAEFVPTRIPQAAPLADSNRADIAAEYLCEEIEQPAVGLPDLIDAADFFAAGGTAENLIALVDAAPTWTPAIKIETGEPTAGATMPRASASPEIIVLPSGAVSISESARVIFQRIAPRRTLFWRGGVLVEISEVDRVQGLDVLKPEKFRSDVEKIGQLYAYRAAGKASQL